MEGSFIFLVMAKTGSLEAVSFTLWLGASSSFILIGFFQLMFSIYTLEKCCS